MYKYQIDVDYDMKSDSLELMERYRKFYLQAMNLKEFDNKKINIVFDYLLSKIENTSYFKPVFSLNCGNDIFNDNWTKLVLMFSIQSFKYMHLCLQEFFTTNKVSEENIDWLAFDTAETSDGNKLYLYGYISFNIY